MADTLKTAFITGASSGFGAAIAERLAKRGFHLVLLARRKDRLDKIAASLAVPVHTIACDVRDEQALLSAVSALPPQFAAIDVLVNNAGLALGLEPAHAASWADCSR